MTSHRSRRWRSGPALVALTALATLTVLVATATPAAAKAPQVGGPTSQVGGPTSRWIVTLRDDADVPGFVAPTESRLGFVADQVFTHVAHGFAAALTAAQRTALAHDPRVAAIRPDRPVELADQTVPPGVRRVQADVSPVAKIDGTDERVDADIAIIDTGIQRNHPDLNVVGGYNCVGSNHADWDDVEGHGTHVAGIAAAKDNSIGVVGVAPGARLWAVRVFPPHGTSWESWIACGLEWVAAQKDSNDPDGERIEVVNMSLRGSGGDDGWCGGLNNDLMHRAVCDAVAAGVTVVVAAGNDRKDASLWTPASYDEAITVSAIADYDGKSGGHGSPPCSTSDRDDSFADFSNYGADVDIAAPGVCVLSTFWGSSYARISGTSMAAPHVAGGAALYKAAHPTALPSAVRGALQAAAAHDWFTSTDRDSMHEGLLDVGSLTIAKGFSLVAGPTSTLHGPGQIARYRVSVQRRGGFTGGIDMSATGLLTGSTATFSPSRLTGTADFTLLEVTAPEDGPAATTRLKVTGTSGTTQRYTYVEMRFEPSLAGGADAPIAHLPRGTEAGAYALPTTVRWAAVDGATKYEFESSTFDGAWHSVPLSSGTRTSLERWEWPGYLYRYRIRALVDGEWGAWLTGSRHAIKDHSGPADLIRYSPGDWTLVVENDTYSTRPLYATHAGATATMTFTAREVAVILTRAPNRGKANIYVDGSYAATVDTLSSSRRVRAIVFAKAWVHPGKHTIEIRVNGTPGRPRIDFDVAFTIS